MNKIYRTVYNAATGTWVVASELAKGRKKSSKSAVAVAVAALLALPAGAAFAADDADSEKDDETIGQMNTALSTKVDDTYFKDSFSGTAASVTGVNSVALGAGSSASNTQTMALGFSSQATGLVGTAVGSQTVASGVRASAFGARANASADFSVALGASSIANRPYAVSVGSDDPTGFSGVFTRQIINVGAGTAATDAVNVSQLTPVVTALGGGATINPDGSVTGPSYTLANGTGTPATTIGDALGQLDGALTTTNGKVGDLETKLGSGTIGLVQQAGAGQKLTVGKDTDGTVVDFTNNASASRTLTGVAAGAVAAGSTDAINGAQLHAVSSSVASAIGAGSSVNADGSISAPSFTVGDGKGGTTTVNNVGAVVSNLDGRTTTNENSITTINKQLGDLSSGTIGLVQQLKAGDNLTVGAATDGAAVSFKGTAGNRQLIDVAAGSVSNTSTDAVTGAQLYGTASSVASAIGAGSTVNPDGSITAPSFTVGDGKGGTTTVTNVGAVVSNLDGRTTTNETSITDINNKLSSGSIGLVQQAGAKGDVTVAAGSGGTAVNFAGTDGVRVLSGIGAGIGNNDAVSVGQLKSVIGYNIVDPLDPLMAVRYDDASMNSVSFGGSTLFGTVLNNVGAGLIASGSLQAVNGGQLFDMQAKYDGLIGDLDSRVGNIEAGGIGGPGTGTPEGSVPSPGKGDGSTAVGAGSDASGKNSSAIGNGAVASGSGSTAVGNGAVASGENSTALGQGAQASNNNSVAIGAGSKTDRDNEVSFGSPGNERILSNVADGVRDTDAVNVRQMNNAIGGLNNKIDSTRSDAMGGVAAAMAVAGLPASSAPGKTFMAIAGSTYGGEQGTAIGASYMSKNGKWLVKGAVNTSTRGEVGAVVGGGFYW